MPSIEIHGDYAPRFAGVRDAFAANFTEGREVGASFAATLDGEAVIDLWAGDADAARRRPWQRDTIANVFSTTKAMTALCAHLLVDRGLLECDFGEWTGGELKALGKLPEWTTVQRYPSGFRFPGGESFVEMQARMTDTIARLVAAHPGSTVVAVSHADPIKTAVAHALGTHLDLFQRIAVFTASVTAIAYGPAGPTVLAVNTTRGDLVPLAAS